MALALKNNATSTLVADISAIATTLQVAEPDLFPQPGMGDWFPLTLESANRTIEVMRCIGRAGAILTVQRAQEGTAAVAFAAGSRVEVRLTVETFDASFNQDNMRDGEVNKNFTVDDRAQIAHLGSDLEDVKGEVDDLDDRVTVVETGAPFLEIKEQVEDLRDETAVLRDQAALSATAAATEVFNRFTSTEAGIVATANGDTFWVIGTAGGQEVLHLWKNNAGVAQDMGLALPSYLAYALLSTLIQDLSSPDTVTAWADMYRFVIGRLQSDGSLSTLLFSIETSPDGGIRIRDQFGFVPLRIGPNGTHIDGLTNTAAAKLPSDPEPWIGPRIFGWAGEEQQIYTELLFPALGDAELCVATIVGSGTTANGTVGVYPGKSDESDRCLTFDPGKLGTTAHVVGRPRAYDGGPLYTRTVNIIAAPATEPPPEQKSPVIFTIGESNSQFVMQFCGPKLVAKNFTPIAPGTRTFGGYGSEGRDGWETGHMTGAVTTGPNVSLITHWPTYMALSNGDKAAFSPFHRLPTEADPPEIIINGRVLDFAWYQANTGIPTPTDVPINLGTNDIARLPVDEVYPTIYGNMLYIYRRLHAAWPLACLHHWHPIFPRSFEADNKRAHFRNMIRGMQDAIRIYDSTKAWLVPTWLSSSTVAFFDLEAGTVNPNTGVRSASIIDWKHPRGGARVEMFRVLAASLAARARGLIGV